VFIVNVLELKGNIHPKCVCTEIGIGVCGIVGAFRIKILVPHFGGSENILCGKEHP
jgi:predicted ThiF/HesA family dinucleotide-utilizing enzyme